MFEKYGKNILRRNPQSGPYEVVIDMKGLKLSLTFEPDKPPVDMGKMAVGEGKKVRLYIVPRGTVSARMNYDKKEYTLNGFGMFQHQWGDSPQKDAASDMFAIHLKDGSDIIAYHSTRFPSINVLLYAEKNGEVAITRDFSAAADTIYKIPGSKDQFAMEWQIELTEKLRPLTLKPTFDGQEISLLGLPYWLGRCNVESTLDGDPARGIGYVYLRVMNR